MKVSYIQLLKMLDRGIIGVVKNEKPHFSFGFRGGSYLGAPGKDIFFALFDLSEEEKMNVAEKLANLYPHQPPGNHVKWAACIRYIYGCFEKQGCLRSKSDKRRMIKENPDWLLPMNFMKSVASIFEKQNNKYGLVLHYEMLAHRWGDRAIIEKNFEHLNTMMKYYKQSYSLAKEIHCWKQTFTPYYWAAGYYQTMGYNEEATKYYKKCLRNMEKNCPDAREGYREKVRTALLIIRKNSSKEEWKDFSKWYKKCKNKCLKKVKI